ncbi:hypothetical protein [Oryzifoliimicrobium ureilyticus]|uniref:hypothetical protein n=1 Tax=Oryzifoliimicrobium ureilyticus TaxID=3113724 RepID=UPI0030764DF2
MTFAAAQHHRKLISALKQGLIVQSSRLWPSVLAYSLLVMALIAALKIPNASDYVGADNDDAMRLVEVRDFLSGQGWFDLHQYRLGSSGTLMHWSRFIDLPIAVLVRFFSFFLSSPKAEAAALIVWPFSLIIPVMAGMGLAGRRIGGVMTMHFSLILTAFIVMASNRFGPGSIDHHNAQMGLVAIMLAMLLDPSAKTSSAAASGIAAAMAMAIGAETTPFIAVFSMTVALRWGWEGKSYDAFASAYGLSLAGALTFFFFATVPRQSYAVVTCDNLSVGFYSLAAIGGVLLGLSSRFAGGISRSMRFVCLGATGIVLAAAARIITPACLENPLSGLDPLVVQFWLSLVGEAQSIVTLMRSDPASLGFHYATGFLALSLCLFQVWKWRQVTQHLLLLPLLAVSLAIAAVQVRGAMFSNLIAILPLALAVAQLRHASMAERGNPIKACAYILSVFASVASVWGLLATLVASRDPSNDQARSQVHPACYDENAFQSLKGLPPGLVDAPVDMGVPVLRFTAHSALSAPYHRNASGILAQIETGLKSPEEAESVMRKAGVTFFAFCDRDAQVAKIIEASPTGLYARMKEGFVPSYLSPVSAQSGSAVRFYRLSSP